MTVQQAEAILLEMGVAVAYQHRFCGDKGTILRLENYSMINIFDDGRYYVQGDNLAVITAFSSVEEPWDPNASEPETVLPWLPERSPEPPKRFDF